MRTRPRVRGRRVLGRLPFGLNSGRSDPNGLLCSVPSRYFCFWLSPIGRQNRVWARIGWGGWGCRGVWASVVVRAPGGRPAGVARILCMPYHLAHIVTLSDAPFPRRALPVSHRRLTGVALWGGTHTARRPNRGHAGSSPSGRAPAQRASNAARARRSTS